MHKISNKLLHLSNSVHFHQSRELLDISYPRRNSIQLNTVMVLENVDNDDRSHIQVILHNTYTINKTLSQLHDAAKTVLLWTRQTKV